MCPHARARTHAVSVRTAAQKVAALYPNSMCRLPEEEEAVVEEEGGGGEAAVSAAA